jgi:hypothetical protein
MGGSWRGLSAVVAAHIPTFCVTVDSVFGWRNRRDGHGDLAGSFRAPALRSTPATLGFARSGKVVPLERPLPAPTERPVAQDGPDRADETTRRFHAGFDGVPGDQAMPCGQLPAARGLRAGFRGRTIPRAR